MYRLIFSSLLLIIFSLGPAAYAGSSLLYIEGQTVGGYSTAEGDGLRGYSGGREDVMQRNGMGFDYIQKFSGEGGDIGMLAIQGRIVYKETEEKYAEPQLYNAYAKAKLGAFDLWAGHNRIPFGLASYFDTHAQILPNLTMRGISYDRDWGAGIISEFEDFDIQFAGSTGSGMPLIMNGNYLMTARASYGVLARDNFNIGISGAWGETVDTMGYHVMMDEPSHLRLAGLDAAWLIDRFELRAEWAGGKKMDETMHAFFLRFTVNFLEENRLKLEAQPVVLYQNGKYSDEYSGGFTFTVNGDLTLRAIYSYDRTTREHLAAAQAYMYLKMI